MRSDALDAAEHVAEAPIQDAAATYPAHTGGGMMLILAIYITAAWVWLFVAGLAMVPL